MATMDRSMSTEAIFAHLSDWDPHSRHQAREMLVQKGVEIIPQLVKKLSDPDWQVRWESAKALGEIGHPSAVQPLVRLLKDDDTSVRWAAMSSLIMFGRASIQPMLLALTQDYQSARLRQAIHHVLHSLSNKGMLTHLETDVFHALEGALPAISAAQLANQALITEFQGPSDQKIQ